jgi:tellurite resistance-related uncharacterized protein
VELYSVWGSSEMPAADGNTRPIKSVKGEQAGRHVREALKRGFQLGFMGGGDIHDGRPGDDLHNRQPECSGYADLYPQGFTAVSTPLLTRESVFDALAARSCYASTRRGIYAEMKLENGRLAVQAAAEDGIAEAVLVVNGESAARVGPEGDPRVLDTAWPVKLGQRDFAYVRISTTRGDLAWLSPVWGNERRGRV